MGQNKYKNIVKNQLGKELEHVIGINIMVPKDDMCEKLKECKDALQESLSLDFVEHNSVLAAYTNVKKTVEWLLSKESLKETILVPNEKLIGSIYTGDGSSVEKDHPSSINTGRTVRRTISVSCDSSHVL